MNKFRQFISPTNYKDYYLINGKRWFLYLSARSYGDQSTIPYTDEEKAREPYSLYRPDLKDPERLLNPSGVVISWQNKNLFGSERVRRFAYFSSFNNFFTYLTMIPVEYWNFYEVILGDNPHRFYIDLDVESNHLDKPIPEGLSPKQCAQVVAEDFIKAFLTLVPTYDPRNIVYLTAHSNEKGSIHLIFNKVHILNHNHGFSYLRKCKQGMRRDLQCFVDRMFKSVQQFRLVYSSKFGSERFLDPSMEFLYNGKMVESILKTLIKDIPVQRERTRIIFQTSFVSVLSQDGILLPVFPEEEVKHELPSQTEHKRDYIYPEIKGDKEEIRKLVEKEIGIRFYLRKTSKPNYLIFERHKKGPETPCPLCPGLTHSSNPYIVFLTGSRYMIMCGARQTRGPLAFTDSKKEAEISEEEIQKQIGNLEEEREKLSKLNANKDPKQAFSLFGRCF